MKKLHLPISNEELRKKYENGEVLNNLPQNLKLVIIQLEDVLKKLVL